MDKPYWFRLNEKTPDGLKLHLESLSGTERSAFIRNAILWYWRFGEQLGSIDQKLDQVLDELRNGVRPMPSNEPLTEFAEESVDDSYLEDAVFSIIST